MLNRPPSPPVSSDNVSAYVDTLDAFQRKSNNLKRKEWAKNILPFFRNDLVPPGLHTDFWNGWLCTSFPTPCLDGEHIYGTGQ